MTSKSIPPQKPQSLNPIKAVLFVLHRYLQQHT
ncbi:hypothetical protein FOPG_18186 [Fusarium oxysporum f. sp. conglutinans race 2 54008]|uniref:Uncharacterized protein n=1 Tax=Fusarium oxysporum f. sp. conglutinans race 2 54008 TaxID=1089457 RepID=X0H0G5_FUSOX|nr:hypothetical protein FOPG_18186 [Fusarium oxysporum f. sp. conglutinans race 2 54008]